MPRSPSGPIKSGNRDPGGLRVDLHKVAYNAYVKEEDARALVHSRDWAIRGG